MPKDDRVCAQLFCFDAGSGYCVSYRPAAEGSRCGDNQVKTHICCDNNLKYPFCCGNNLKKLLVVVAIN